MRTLTIAMAMAVLSILSVPAGCSSVTFLPVGPDESFPPKPEGYEILTLESDEAGDYRIIGQVSCQDSASSSIWNGWTDQKALVQEMQNGNIALLVEKVREVGGDALIEVQHELGYGGSSGGMGMGVGLGSSGVGIGVGTTILGGNPTIIVVTYGHVGVRKTPTLE
ncbi:MAG: hypothetical protein ABIK28_11685 [Planctomycetota bacterium]